MCANPNWFLQQKLSHASCIGLLLVYLFLFLLVNEIIDEWEVKRSKLYLSHTKSAASLHQQRTLTPYILLVCSSPAPCLLAAPTMIMHANLLFLSVLQNETTSCHSVNKHQTVANGHLTMQKITRPANMAGSIVINLQNTIMACNAFFVCRNFLTPTILFVLIPSAVLCVQGSND